ncbi:hypothetical protein KKC08_00825 [Patescibacteria group bacterium]|nr:hypothetical protein [Patescibacteria group bacterium]MCG2702211.1 hypothetical protein [Candidatus Parcubacteria bacterium]MBU4264775.1 hypothetical protein [Patescibacteria group bacterium]MBU4390113.1 hypothetical protein [Patescibacteria group bacterium]MBU4396696.1 hypothetical protein [Patescibacteria group bacterium]
MTKEKSTKKPWLKWLLTGLIVLTVLAGYKFYKSKKILAARRELMQKQRDIMMEKWREDGLTEEEINQKMQDMRQQRMDSGERPSEGSGMFPMGRGIMRMHP